MSCVDTACDFQLDDHVFIVNKLAYEFVTDRLWIHESRYYALQVGTVALVQHRSNLEAAAAMGYLRQSCTPRMASACEQSSEGPWNFCSRAREIHPIQYEVFRGNGCARSPIKNG